MCRISSREIWPRLRSRGSQLQVLWRQVYAHRLSTKQLGHVHRGSDAAEWVKDNAFGRACCQQWDFAQIRWIGSEVRLPRLGIFGENVPPIGWFSSPGGS